MQRQLSSTKTFWALGSLSDLILDPKVLSISVFTDKDGGLMRPKVLEKNCYPVGYASNGWSKWILRKNMDVSENSGTPKSSILIGFSITNHPFWGTTIFGNTHMLQKISSKTDSLTLRSFTHMISHPRNPFGVPQLPSPLEQPPP